MCRVSCRMTYLHLARSLCQVRAVHVIRPVRHACRDRQWRSRGSNHVAGVACGGAGGGQVEAELLDDS